jgi:uncharacterized SAM-binding protein YcdF (DUF218 family)
VRLLMLSVVAVAVVVAGFAWLGAEDAITPCPVAVVLNGDHPGRADEAAALYQRRVAGEIWLTSDPKSSDAGVDTGTTSNAERLVTRGVPESAIRVLDGAASGTRAELGIVRAAAERRHVPCVLAVTSAPHAARVRLLWWRLGGAPPRLVVRHAREAGYAGWRAHAKELGLTLGTLLGLAR